MPRRGPEAGVLRIKLDFHCSGVNSRSCLFLQSQKIHLYALIIAILQRFNLKKIVPIHGGNHKIISTISFLFGLRMQSIMRCWRLGGGSVSRGNPHTSSLQPDLTSISDERFHPSGPQNRPSFRFPPTLVHPASDRPSKSIC